MLAREPEHVGVEQKKKDEADGEEIHVKAKEDTGLKEIPLATAHAAERVGATNDSDTGGNGEEGIGVVVRKAGEEIGCSETEEHKDVASQEGSFVRIEDTGSHAVPKMSPRKDRPCGLIRFEAMRRRSERHGPAADCEKEDIYSPTLRKGAKGGAPERL